MEKIKLENQKASLLFGIVSLALGFALLHFGLNKEMVLRVSGARIDKSTSSILLCIISIGPFINGVDQLLKYVSLLRYGEFVIVLDDEKITFPEKIFFRGFRPKQIYRNRIAFVQMEKTAQHRYQLNLMDDERRILASIPGELPHRKAISVKDLAMKIQNWVIL